ncbi:AraC family transcriptional regulator [Providencia manganoxydans]|uniref:helix-turn-helix transcriptional regulator n=1 Tax=Providencia manganoxydans TaxID=2923283 RepID=UPI0032DBD0F4
MSMTTFGELKLYYLRYGDTVQIQHKEQANCFILHIPLRSDAALFDGTAYFDQNNEHIVLINQNNSSQLIWDHQEETLLIFIPYSLLERTLVSQLGHLIDTPIVFETALSSYNASTWRHLAKYLLSCISDHEVLRQQKYVVSQLEKLIVSSILSTFPHNHSAGNNQRISNVCPRHVKKAQDFLHIHAHENITMEQLALVAGVSSRSLYSGFRHFLNVSPMQYLKTLRLDKVRSELLSGDVNNITGIALRWGFAHMGRFSAEYKARFGETPSQSLKGTLFNHPR